MPAFFALLPVRDEADIIGQCLDHAMRWADEVYVFDTGSVDNAWEIVQEFASRDKRVVPMEKNRCFSQRRVCEVTCFMSHDKTYVMAIVFANRRR